MNVEQAYYKDNTMEEWAFNRHVDDKLINELNKTTLWQEWLKNDCKSGEVFLALRKDCISFYHKGGSLFKFDSDGFSTHVKYASVIDTNNEDAEKNKIYEKQLGKKMPLIKNFISGYSQIKKNCELYSGKEAIGVSHLLKNSTYLLKNESYIVLDIEIVLKDKKKDRIDILLFDTTTKMLRFVEAKHFTNDDIWAKGVPNVVKQIHNYENQIDLHKKNIIAEYSRYIKNINRIFNMQLPSPKEIDKKVSLLIFGFDDAQKKDDRFKTLILEKPEYQDIPIYSRGKQDGLKAETIWKETK